MTEPLLRVLSLGAGVQSSTLYLMACAGEFGEESPTVAIFADTQWEPPAVYEWLKWLESIGSNKIPIRRVSLGNLREDALTQIVPKKKDAKVSSYPKVTHLSQLSHEESPRAAFLFDLWQASEGVGLLRDALSAVQEAWRPAGVQGAASEGVPGVRDSGEREESVRSSLYAGQAGQVDTLGEGGTGVSLMQVRRLTPL